jgi:hypothetical protein
LLYHLKWSKLETQCKLLKIISPFSSWYEVKLNNILFHLCLIQNRQSKIGGNGRRFKLLGSKPPAAVSAVKKLVKCNKNSASASSTPVV